MRHENYYFTSQKKKCRYGQPALAGFAMFSIQKTEQLYKQLQEMDDNALKKLWKCNDYGGIIKDDQVSDIWDFSLRQVLHCCAVQFKLQLQNTCNGAGHKGIHRIGGYV